MNDRRGIGATALLLWNTLKKGDVLYLADDEQEAEAVAGALNALAPDVAVVFLPSSDALPGDGSPASPANVGRRVAALRNLRRIARERHGPRLAAIMSGEAAARVYAAPSSFDAALPLLRTGETIDTERFAQHMEELGYVVDDRVDEPGELAVRGEVVDIFPADAGFPARIDLVDGRIAGIRRYDPLTQLSLEDCGALEIGRAVEPATEARASILEHLRPGFLLQSSKADERRRRFIRLAMEASGDDRMRYDAISDEVWSSQLKPWTLPEDVPNIQSVPRFAEQRSPLSAFAKFVRPLLKAGYRLLLAGSERDLRFLRPRIHKALDITLLDATSIDQVNVHGAALVAPVDRGAVCEPLIMIAAADLLGSRAVIDDVQEPMAAGLHRSSGDIRAGDVVVHEEHGVGRAIGLEQAPKEATSEVIALEYAEGARRLVPTREAGRIWRYGADADAVKLDRLDGSSWNKRRGEIQRAIEDGVKALLHLAEQRSRIEAAVMAPDPTLYERFVSSFPFNETADQARAIEAVRTDLSSGKPMDRLIIGDVGYGKTEVALRAAALAALAGYQVVVAAPTTVLVRQHVQTFQRRFAGTAVQVAGLSRLSSAAEKKAVKTGLADGSIGVVIGTGAVMAKDVRYANLGLVIIDEEQRFGAADKNKLRGRSDIHLLSMSATPIPRTLHRAMIGLQQISVINTPPARRQPIRTSIGEPDDARLRTALLRERSRGGQSFVVVPRIEDLGPISSRLRRIIPGLDLIEAHGKMTVAEIDEAMVRFGDGKGDVLLATNIIEAGLDIPRANTMIIWRADRFGLAQLHQLRGRVGRGNRRGQVMLLTDGGEIAERTMKRLRTLATHDRLGAGFEISAADLDQRGAGDLLSDTQAGHMKLIGVDLYQHLFAAALRQSRGEDPGLWMPEVNVNSVSATLPREWIPDDDVRLSLYVRVARAASEADLEAFESELVDRFGPLPPEAHDLISLARISILARASNISRIDAGPAAIALTPHEKEAIPDGHGLIEKEGRWLLRERTNESGAIGSVLKLLEDLATTDAN